MRALALCWPIPKISKINYRELWKIAVLLLVLLSGVDFSSASMSVGAAVSASLLSWSCTFRAAMRGKRRVSAALGTINAMVWSV